MNVFIIGNPDLPSDDLPHRLLPGLQAAFPKIAFTELDPNEEFEFYDRTIFIDTVQGINKPKLFTNLDDFVLSPRNTMHDFDLLAQLKLYKKINPDFAIGIIGIPAGSQPKEILSEVINLLSTLL